MCAFCMIFRMIKIFSLSDIINEDLTNTINKELSKSDYDNNSKTNTLVQDVYFNYQQACSYDELEVSHSQLKKETINYIRQNNQNIYLKFSENELDQILDQLIQNNKKDSLKEEVYVVRKR